MAAGFLQRWFGRDPATPGSGKAYAPPAGAVVLAQMNQAQRHVADIFLIRVTAYCELHRYPLASFQGPFIWPVADAEGRRTAAVVLGPCDLPGYAVWELEMGSPHGTIGGFGDSRGEFKVYRESMVLPETT